jgi:heptose I phosphotransferase
MLRIARAILTGYPNKTGSVPIIPLIDLHRAQLRKKTPRRWVVKDVAGLYFSVMDIGLTQRDLFRFVKMYTGLSLRRALTSEFRFLIAVERVAKRLYAKEERRREVKG